MGSTFNDLPQEVQHLVFDNLTCLSDRRTRLKEFVLVSKDWKSFFQPQLYKLLNFSSLSKFAKFYKAVEKNPYLFSLAVDIAFKFNSNLNVKDIADFEVDSAIAKLFTHSSKLERIDCHGSFFRLLANALKKGHLPLLNFIKPPHYPSELDVYIECVIMIKERLHNLKIVESVNEDTGDVDPIPFNRLFDKLDQFKRLEILHIEKESDNIMNLVEKITRIQPNLHELKLNIEPEDNQNSVVDISGVIKPPFEPVNTVRNLYFAQNILHDAELVLYIIHKFPQVRSLRILEQLEQNSRLNEFVLNKLLLYLSNINLMNIQSIPFIEQPMVDSIELLWKNVSRSRAVSVEFKYEDRSQPMDELSIDTEYGPALFKFSLSSGTELKHIGIIQKHGHYVESLTLFGIGRLTQQSDTCDTLFTQPLQYCTKLKRLSIQSSVVSASKTFNYNITSKRSLDFLRIIGCTFKDNESLGKLSTMLAFVKFLEFSDITLVNNHSIRGIPIMHIDMSETDVGALTLSINPSSSGKSVILVKLTVGNTDTSYYKYCLNISITDIEEQEFYKSSSLDDCFRIGFSCKSLNDIQLY